MSGAPHDPGAARGQAGETTPELAVVVVFYNMRREARRTLYSLSAHYQRGVHPGDYEVIVVDNGSSVPLDAAEVIELGPEFRYLRIPPAEASPSPAAAINRGADLSRAPNVCVMVDGARMATPGVLALGVFALRSMARAVVGTLGFHLGPDLQNRSVDLGYTAEVEDALLADADWRADGYRLFDIGVLAASSQTCWLGPITESNMLFMPRPLFDELGGFDERFDLPGGGFVNLDFYKRATELPETQLISLLGEATFHQVHGGIMTNRPEADMAEEIEIYQRQHLRIHGARYVPPTRVAALLGAPGSWGRAGIERAAALIAQRHGA